MKIQRNHLAWLLIVGGPILLFGPMLVRGEVLYWGTPMLQFVPWRQFAFEVLKSGNLPLWNPLLGMGAPLLANYQSALLYPPNLLLFLFGPEYGHGVLVTLHLIWAGAGMALLVRRLGLGRLSQVIAGLSYSLSGYLVARTWFISINHAAAWLPWIIYATDRLFESVSRKNFRQLYPLVFLLAATFGFQWLAGHAQTAWYSLCLSAAWIIWRAISLDTWRDRLRAASAYLSAGVLGFVLTAAQLLPTLEYLQNTARATAVDPELALTYSFWPWRAFGLLLPDLFGNPSRGNYWGYANFWEDAIYIGIFPLIFAIVGIVISLRGKGSRSSLGRFLTLISVVTMVLALGKNTPVFPFLFDYVPTFDLFHAPARWNLLLVFSLALLAAMGADRWRTPSGRALYWIRLGTAGAAIIGLAGYFGALWLGGVEPTFVRSFAIAGVGLAFAGLLTLFVDKSRMRLTMFLAGGILLIDLLIAGSGLNPSISQEVYEGDAASAATFGRTHRLYMTADLEYALKFSQTHRFDTFDPGIDWRVVREIGLPNTTLLNNIPSANNFDPFVPERYQTWIDALESLPASDQPRLFQLMDVAWLASDVSGDLQAVHYEPIEGSTRVRLIANAVSASSAEEALQLVIKPSFNFDEQVVIETSSASLSQGEVGGTYRILEGQNPNRVEIEVTTPGGAWLVLSDVMYPGWRVYVDNAEAELFHADYLFRGVWVPQGSHAVDFSYQPSSFWLGAAMSLPAWVLALFLYIRWRDE
ncbi:MAG: YfhO family protein [Anaerolineales bacterium]